MRRSTLIDACIICGAVAMLVIGAGFRLTSAPPEKDAAQVVRYAYNLYKYGVFSESEADHPGVQPGYQRGPLQPALFAGVMWLSGDPQTTTMDCLMAASAECLPVLIALKWAQVLLLLGLAVVTFGIARTVVGGHVGPAIAVFSIVYCARFLVDADTLYSETLAALLVALGSRALYGLFVSCGSLRWAAATGVAFAALILVKPVFVYMLPVYVVAGGLLVAVRRSWRAGAPVVVALTITYAVAAGWMTRNYLVDGNFIIAGNGERVLALRVEKNLMPWSDVPAAIYAYTPREVKAAAYNPLFRLPDTSRFDRNNDGSYYRRALSVEGVAARRTGTADPTPQAIDRAARELIREHWIRHAAFTGLFAYRGVFIPTVTLRASDDTRLESWAKLSQEVLITANSVLLMPAMLITAILALRARRYDLLLFLLPSLYNFGIHAAATHFVSRYSLPTVPVAAVMLALTVTRAWHYTASRAGTRRAAATSQRPAALPPAVSPSSSARFEVRNPPIGVSSADGNFTRVGANQRQSNGRSAKPMPLN